LRVAQTLVGATQPIDPHAVIPAYTLVNAQGRFLFGADGLHGGDRSDALVRSVERLDRTQLQDAILAAASSTSR
jgi:hypothetical protein